MVDIENTIDIQGLVDAKDVVVEKGWFDTFKEKLNFDAGLKQLNISKSKVIDVGLFLGLGFLAGFLLRKYSKYFLTVILILIGLFALEKFQIIQIGINWQKLNELFGIQAVKMDGSAISMAWEWIKANLAISISFLIGFSFGFKLG